MAFPAPCLASWGGGGSWLQVLGAFLLVTALLVAALRLLARWQGRGAAGDLRILSISTLGPKRSVETLRYGDEELVIYRSEGAMLLLERREAGIDDASEPPASPLGPIARLFRSRD